MLKLTLIGAFAVTLLVSCKKSTADNDNPPVSQVTLTAGWTVSEINSQQFTNIHFVRNNGIAVSTTAIYGSDDGGQNWQSRSAYGDPVWGIGYRNRRNIAMDSVGHVIISQGLNNTSMNGYSLALSSNYNTFTFIPDKLIINDVCFVKNNTGYAITANDQDSNIHFLRSPDAGNSWNTVSILPHVDNVFMQTGYARLSFINSEVGWVSTHYGIFKTTNGGMSWVHQYVPPGNVTNVSAVDAKTCYIGSVAFIVSSNQEIHKIIKTTDGGTSWQEVFSLITGGIPDLGAPFQAFQFVNTTTGYMVRGESIYQSTDGAATWNKVVTIHSYLSSFFDIHFIDAGHGWACSSGGQILRYQQ